MDPADLRYAAGRNQIGLAFEPLADAATGAVAGFVARAQWTPPDLGPVGAGRVRRMAVAHGIARSLDAWTAELACTAVARWGGEALDALALLAIDVAPLSYADPAVHGAARAAAEIAGVPPGRLRLVADHGDLASALAAFGLARTHLAPAPPDDAFALLTGATAPR